MKLIIALSCLIATISVASTGALEVAEGFLNEEEMDEFRQVPVSEAYTGHRRHGEAFLPESIVRRMMAARKTDTCATTGIKDTKVRTSLIEHSTKEHVDHYQNHQVVHEDVGFVFLNTNMDAHFKHGDDSVPIKAGNMVTFKGDVPHSTSVSSGHVHLLGPFDMVSFRNVGGRGQTTCCGVEVAATNATNSVECFDVLLQCKYACEILCPGFDRCPTDPDGDPTNLDGIEFCHERENGNFVTKCKKPKTAWEHLSTELGDYCGPCV